MKREPPNEDSIKTVQVLYEKGYNVDQIHKMTGVPKSEVRKFIAAIPRRVG